MLRAFRRVRVDGAEHAARAGAAQSRAIRRSRAAGAAAKAGRSRGDRDLAIDAEPRVDIVVLDTIGELATVYQIATVVFVGGSLVATGGHNVLEPAVFGKPIVFGPHMENFLEIAEAFVSNGAGVQLTARSELEEAFALADGRSGAARAARRGGARAGRSQSRRQRQERHRAGGAAAAGTARLSRQRQAVQTPCLIPSTGR